MNTTELFLAYSGLFLSICTLSMVLYVVLRKRSVDDDTANFYTWSKQPYSTVPSPTKHCEVALLCQEDRSSKATADEFEATLKQYGHYRYRVTRYIAPNTQASYFQRFMRDIFHKKYRLLLCIGGNATKNALSAVINEHANLPIIFTHVRNHAWETISEEHPYSLVTGITKSPVWEKRIPLFKLVKKDMKKILVYVNTYISKQELTTILDLFHPIDPIIITPHADSDVVSALERYADQVDAIVSLNATMSDATCHVLAQTALQHKVPFFSSEISDIERGAAVAVSLRSLSIGHVAAQKALAYIEHNNAIDDIGITNVSSNSEYKFKCNPQTLALCGIDPEEIVREISLEYGSTVYINPRPIRLDT